MGSAVSSAIAATSSWMDLNMILSFPDEGPFFLAKQQGWLDKLERTRPHCVVRGGLPSKQYVYIALITSYPSLPHRLYDSVTIAILTFSHTFIARRERDASDALPYVQSALHHYNSNNPVTYLLSFSSSLFFLFEHVIL